MKHGKHGHARNGLQHGCAKLTFENVQAIRADERVQWQIALDYGISQGHVSHLKHRDFWGQWDGN